MRRWTVALAAAVGLVAAAPATGHVYHSSWGYAEIDEQPFNEPGGPLLPPSQAFPRGRMKDAGTPDDTHPRLTITAFDAADRNLYSYSVEDAKAVYRPLDRRIDVSPSQIASLRYDFCTVTNVRCEPSLRIARPVPPGGGGGSPPPVDRDGDGFSPPADCMDTNSTVWPGAREIPGNGIDDDCSGGDQPARLFATVSTNWLVTRRGTRVRRLTVREAPPGARITVLCRHSRSCPFRQRALTVDADGIVALKRLFPRRLRPGAGLEIRITAANMIGRVVRYRIKRKDTPVGRTLCLPPGASKPSKC